jgi:4-diphosphocytidyl-2-C-methyl-D-erythritol kinase
MVAFPPCKINLGLNIIRRRPDGYHDIETCFYPVPWTDILEVIPSDKFEFTTSGMAIPGDDNLCVKAYQLLKAPPAKIHLHKIIPTGAGLGGGSSDAAWTLRLLNDVFDLKHSKEKLKEYAATLGSDCSFFIDDIPMIGKGRGEVLSPSTISLKGKFIVIITPDVHVSTADAYAGIIPGGRKVEWEGVMLEELKNDFEETIFKKFPEIRSIKEELYKAGAEYASMSGSGSSVYGIFPKKPSLEKKSSLSPAYSGWL